MRLSEKIVAMQIYIEECSPLKPDELLALNILLSIHEQRVFTFPPVKPWLMSLFVDEPGEEPEEEPEIDEQPVEVPDKIVEKIRELSSHVTTYTNEIKSLLLHENLKELKALTEYHSLYRHVKSMSEQQCAHALVLVTLLSDRRIL